MKSCVIPRTVVAEILLDIPGASFHNDWLHIDPTGACLSVRLPVAALGQFTYLLGRKVGRTESECQGDDDLEAEDLPGRLHAMALALRTLDIGRHVLVYFPGFITD